MTPLDLPALDRMEAAATPGPVKWHKCGKSWLLVGDYGDQPYLLDIGPGRVRDLKLGVMVPFDSEHPDAKRIVEILNAWPSLSSRMRAMQEEIEAWRVVEREGASDDCCDECDERMKRLAAARARTDALAEREGKDDDGTR